MGQTLNRRWFGGAACENKGHFGQSKRMCGLRGGAEATSIASNPLLSLPVTGTGVPGISAGETWRAADADPNAAPGATFRILLGSEGDIHYIITSEVVGDGSRDLSRFIVAE